jgi:hypothetical protein
MHESRNEIRQLILSDSDKYEASEKVVLRYIESAFNYYRNTAALQ